VGSPLERYTELAIAECTTVTQVDSQAKVPDAIANYLHANHLSLRVVLDSQLPVAVLAWVDSGLELGTLPLNKDGDTLISDCYGAVAESGALVITSNDGVAIANDFLAETHIILLHAGQIFSGLAELWQALRIAAGDKFMPREFCLVTGPSRTADLGVPAKMGAHGPARVHVVIIDA
jgi:L-lactate dehydrogenase complex protein LldG